MLIKNKEATFYARASGNSMTGAGIDDGDILVIDRSLEPLNNKIAVCFIDGDFTVKRISIEKDCVYLVPENNNYQPIKVTEENQLLIWGIVTFVVKSI
ncbi:putative UmuD/RumA DNA repair protein [Flavobacterium cauense R2A-7]|nr:putative UmuD/RumA DNA repair protein [Flavobacterium cauense R2A-7]